MANETASSLLTESDPDPILIVKGRAPWLLTVEHAGHAIPARLSGLGLPDGEVTRHIGWDPGALDLAMALRDRLDAHLVAQRFSRLVIDCNRPDAAPDLIPHISDATVIPGNADLSKAGRQARWDAIHAPFHATVSERVSEGVEYLLAIHTYDARRDVDPAPRPWPIGLLWRKPNPLAEKVSAALGHVSHVQPLGLNQPYQIEDASDYTIPIHAEPRNLGHVLIEVRNDLLQRPADVEDFADLIFSACTAKEPA